MILMDKGKIYKRFEHSIHEGLNDADANLPGVPPDGYEPPFTSYQKIGRIYSVQPIQKMPLIFDT